MKIRLLHKNKMSELSKIVDLYLRKRMHNQFNSFFLYISII